MRQIFLDTETTGLSPEAGDRVKGQFLAMMSHEVRTPLNGIVGFTQLLGETALTPEQRDYAQTIRMSGETLLQLTGDILDFARIDSGKLKLEPEPCDVRACVEDTLDLLAARAAEKRIELLHFVDPAVPARVMADPSRLRQVIVNLLTNAVKFTDVGEVEVRVTVAPDEAGGADLGLGAGSDMGGTPMLLPDSGKFPAPHSGGLVFTVRDTGIGIPEDQQAKLFRPFSQVDQQSTRRYGGTGLGLAVARALVERHGGMLAHADASPHGTVMTAEFPADHGDPDAERTRGPVPSSAPSTKWDPPVP